MVRAEHRGFNRQIPNNSAEIVFDTGVAHTGTRPLHDQVCLVALDVHRDERGALTVAQVDAGLPFTPVRYFVITDVPARAERGGHAHRRSHELLSCVHGGCVIDVENGSHRASYTLADPGLALYLPPLTWAVERDFSDNCALLVMSSTLYDPGDYLHDHDEFVALVGSHV